jgi:alkylation response protein AidB-like acyl-CoA dehydrogenase
VTAASADPVAAARALAQRAAELAERAERERRLPAELSAAIAEAGLYRLCVPAALGGGEAHPRVLVEAIEALAEGDAAAGWCLAISATSGSLAGYLREDAAREVYGPPLGVVGGVFAPTGRAVADGDRFVVNGRWRFASNCENCDWLMGGCVVLDGDAPRLLSSGRPDIRLVLFPRADVEVIDTWHVSGLRGTGSHDMAVSDLEVPAERSASLISDAPLVGSPLYTFPAFGLLAIGIAAVTLGIARSALNDVLELAGAKTPTLSTRKLAQRPATQSEVARAEATLSGGRALLVETIDEAFEAAAAGGAISLEIRARLRMAATHAVECATSAVDAAYRLAGGSAIYETSPLQRRFRDVHAATQHMLVAPATWEVTGRALLGLEIDDAQL